MTGCRRPDEDAFDWVPDEPPQPFDRRAVAIAMMIRLALVAIFFWWIFGKFSSDLSKLFDMGRTFILR